MAEAQSTVVPTLSERYHLKEKEDKSGVVSKPLEVKETENSVSNTSEEAASEKIEALTTGAESVEVTPVSSEESSEPKLATDKTIDEPAPAAEESNETTEEESAGNEEAAEETAEIKVETAPADFRFPTTNQTRHCFTRYVEYHRCVAAKGEGAPECDRFAKYYRSLCPGEWVERWNEQRETGTFPGPL